MSTTKGSQYLNDLRLVGFAVLMEEAFERRQEYLMQFVTDPDVRAKLASLFSDGPFHKRLHKAEEDMERSFDPNRFDPDDVLTTLAAMEKTSREFYAQNAERLHDPHLVTIFRGMAKEEARHGEAVREAQGFAAAERAKAVKG